MKIEELSKEEKVGQMFMIGLDMPNAIDVVEDLILRYKIGGILLYKKNYKNEAIYNSHIGNGQVIII